MLRLTFIGKLAGAFTLGSLTRLMPRKREAPIFVYSTAPDEMPKWIVHQAERPSAVEAQYWLDRGFTHCSWGGVAEPLTNFVTPLENVRIRL